MPFLDRVEAGRLLAEKLARARLRAPLVLALPRGGVVVANEVARRLNAPLEALIVHKLGAPRNPEYGVGAVVEGGSYQLDHDAVMALGMTGAQIRELVLKESREVERRVALYRGGRPLPSLKGRTVVVVDDGLATGATAGVAIAFLEAQGARKALLAVPVCSPRAVQAFRSRGRGVICLDAPPDFSAVGQSYDDFAQVSDEQVVSILAKGRRHAA